MSNSVYRRRFQTDSYAEGDLVDSNDSGLNQIILNDSVSKGDVIPHWRKVIADGGNATTNMSGTRWTCVQTPASLDSRLQYLFTTPPVGSRRTVIKGNLLELSFALGGNPTLGLAETSAKNQALSRYYQHVASVSTKFQGMVFTGELRESLNMIRHPARAFRNGISDYLSFLRRNARKVAKRQRASFVRKTWLEYSFGWRPLVNDIDQGIKAFYASKHAHPIFEMVKGTARDETAVVNPLVDDIDVGSGHRVTYAHRSVEEVYFKYFGIYRSSGQGVPDSHAYGFSPSEFIPTVWELIPYSFLVDYFTNIGNILSSWSYRNLVNGWTSVTTRKVFSHTCENIQYKWDPRFVNPHLYSHSLSGHPGSAAYQFTSFVRLRDAPLDIPSLELKVPGRWDQWVNILALTKQHKATVRAISPTRKTSYIDFFPSTV